MAFDLRLAFQLHAEFGEERDGGIRVLDDGDVVQPLNGHVSAHKQRRAAGRTKMAPPAVVSAASHT